MVAPRRGATWIIKADLVVRRQSPYRELEFTRRRTMVVGDLSVAVVSPEDLILSKLDWARTSASASQYQDVAQLLAAVSGLDIDYLEHWAGTLGVLEQLRELGRS